jgi:hypothetical protein
MLQELENRLSFRDARDLVLGNILRFRREFENLKRHPADEFKELDKAEAFSIIHLAVYKYLLDFGRAIFPDLYELIYFRPFCVLEVHHESLSTANRKLSFADTCNIVVIVPDGIFISVSQPSFIISQ